MNYIIQTKSTIEPFQSCNFEYIGVTSEFKVKFTHRLTNILKIYKASQIKESFETNTPFVNS